MKTFKLGGIHPRENKLSSNKKIESIPVPLQVAIPLDQHIGAPAIPVVAVGDKVKTGQLIAKAGGFVSANVHSSVSGTVKKIDNFSDAWGFSKTEIIIDVEGDEWMDDIDTTETFKPECTLSSEEILKKIEAAGIVGLGGACFPTHVKLIPPKDCPIDTLIVNAVECEPFLTHNHRMMLEYGREIMVGVNILMKALGIDKAIIGIESNKPDAIENLKKLSTLYHGITVEALKTKYPQGGEKQLIQALTGREVKSGAIPASTGCVVQNVGTVLAIYDAVQKNKPLIDVFMTVTGPQVTNPGNFKVRIGTPLNAVVAAAGGLPENTGKVIGGGPMMGRTYITLDVPASKRTSGLLILPDSMSHRGEEQHCIRCAKCVSACPMGLEPYLLSRLSEMHNWGRSEKERIADCIECGSCMYTCPSNRPLLDYIRIGKAEVMGIIRARNAKK